MRALILAAGYGTRLYPLTRKHPKALLPVAGRPILDYIVGKISRAKEITDIVVVTNDKFFPQFQAWAKKFNAKPPIRTRKPPSATTFSDFRSGMGKRFILSCTIKILNDGTRSEFDRLGAIGDIHFALSKETVLEDTLILGGDNLFEDGLSGFMSFAQSKRCKAIVGVYDIAKRQTAREYGVVKLGRAGKIIDFSEKPSQPQSSLIATCIYYIPKEKLQYFQEYLNDPGNEYDSSGSFIGWLSRKEDVYGFIFKKRWYDIGDPQVYQEANRVLNSPRHWRGSLRRENGKT